MGKLKRIAQIAGASVLGVGLCIGTYVFLQVRAFDASLAHVYDVPTPSLQIKNDAPTLARGKHLAESLGACSARDCHGADLGGGPELDVGPIGTFAAPNVTLVLSAYSDGELARLVRYGIRKDGRGLRFMPSQDFTWWRDDDVAALIAYLRTVPRVDRPNGTLRVGVLGKVLDRREMFKLDVARRLAGQPVPVAPEPAANKEYGAFLGRLCDGCHGQNLSGGPIPGAPPSLPIPPNLTPHETGLGADYTFEQFTRLLNEGVKKSGQKLDKFMPYETLAKMDDTEKHALFAFLRSLPPRPYGGR